MKKYCHAAENRSLGDSRAVQYCHLSKSLAPWYVAMIAPLYEQLNKYVMQSDVFHETLSTDESIVP